MEAALLSICLLWLHRSRVCPIAFAYCATKGAVIGLTKSIAADFVKQNIRCNAICPGTVDSPSMHERLKATGDYDKAMQDFIARQPMGRIARSEEMPIWPCILPVMRVLLLQAKPIPLMVVGQSNIVSFGYFN